ncbi:MAG: hypothetical protein WDO24_14925 [Pseudomonadota bacterium]
MTRLPALRMSAPLPLKVIGLTTLIVPPAAPASKLRLALLARLTAAPTSMVPDAVDAPNTKAW